jgi:hypothetical protein
MEFILPPWIIPVLVFTPVFLAVGVTVFLLTQIKRMETSTLVGLLLLTLLVPFIGPLLSLVIYINKRNSLAN